MADVAAAVAPRVVEQARPRPRRRGVMLRLAGNQRVVVGFAVLLLTFLVALFAAQLAPYDPNAQVLTARLGPPSSAHPFGSDQLVRRTKSFLPRPSQLGGL